MFLLKSKQRKAWVKKSNEIKSQYSHDAIALAAMHRDSSVIEEFANARKLNLIKSVFEQFKQLRIKSNQAKYFTNKDVGIVTSKYILTKTIVYGADRVPLTDSRVFSELKRDFTRECDAVSDCRCGNTKIWNRLIGRMGFLTIQGTSYPAVVIPSLFKHNESTEKVS